MKVTWAVFVRTPTGGYRLCCRHETWRRAALHVHSIKRGGGVAKMRKAQEVTR